MDLEQITINSNASIFRKIKPESNKCVCHPTNLNEVKTSIEKARKLNLPIVPKGGGTSLSGACTGGNLDKVVITSRALKTIHQIDVRSHTAVVDAGVTPVELNKQLEPLGFKFFVSPSSESAAHLGGMVNTDAGGADAWLNGTMLDNTVSVDLIDYEGNEIQVSHDKAISFNKNQNRMLQDLNLKLSDIAQSHGTIGFIHRLTVRIRPRQDEKINAGLWRFSNVNAFGQALQTIISEKIPLYYGEGIVEVHPKLDVDTQIPLLITSFPERVTEHLQNMEGFELVSRETYLKMRALRKALPKRNPPTGSQKAYFEGYGIPYPLLNKLGDLLSEIDAIWRNHAIEPFLRYGHSPCKWYVDDTPHYGMIMHAREIVAKKTPLQIMRILDEILTFCGDKGLVPKPEHKWPYQNTQKKERLKQIRQHLGGNFNPFIFTASQTDLSSLIL